MTSRRLPPLNALRTFEAAARHGSFSRAAAELLVTHGAVSRQVQALEAWLGLALFERRNRRVVLTEAGRDYLGEVTAALDRVATATVRLTERRNLETVRVNALPTFAMRWLIPHLPSFQFANPRIRVLLATTIEPPSGMRDAFDVAIRRGAGAGWGSIASEPFLAEFSLPVASPALLQRQPVRRLADLAQHTWLHADTRDGEWRDWLALAGAPRLRPRDALRFEHSYFVLQAALDGLGIAMGPSALVRYDLAAGRLCHVFDAPRLQLEPYHVGCAPGASAAARTFADWVSTLAVEEGAEAEEGAEPAASH